MSAYPRIVSPRSPTDPVEAALEHDLAGRRAGEHRLDGMLLRGAAGRQPAAPARRKDQRPARLADERQPVLLLDRSLPERHRQRHTQYAGHRGSVADEAELGEAEELCPREGPGRIALVDPAVGYELDDVARRVVEVAAQRVPVLEVEHDLPGLAVGQQPGSLADPLERRGEAVAGDQEGEVVEGLVLTRGEVELRLADPEPGQLEPLAVERAEGFEGARGSVKAHVAEVHVLLGVVL